MAVPWDDTRCLDIGTRPSSPNSPVRTSADPIVAREGGVPHVQSTSMLVQAAVLDSLLGDGSNLRSLRHFLDSKRVQGILQLTRDLHPCYPLLVKMHSIPPTQQARDYKSQSTQ